MCIFGAFSAKGFYSKTGNFRDDPQGIWGWQMNDFLNLKIIHMVVKLHTRNFIKI